MSDKRYDIICKEARKRIKGIGCILGIIDNGSAFHDSVLQKMEFNADNETLVVDIGDVWVAETGLYVRYRFTFRGYMELNLDYTSGSSFTYEMTIAKEGRMDLLTVCFNSLHLEIKCSDISIEALPYTQSE